MLWPRAATVCVPRRRGRATPWRNRKLFGGVIPIRIVGRSSARCRCSASSKPLPPSVTAKQITHLRDAQCPCLRTHLLRTARRVRNRPGSVCAPSGACRSNAVYSIRCSALLACTPCIGTLKASQAHVGHGLTVIVRCHPLGFRLRRLDHPPFFLLRPQPLPSRLGATQHRPTPDNRTPAKRLRTSSAAQRTAAASPPDTPAASTPD